MDLQNNECLVKVEALTLSLLLNPSVDQCSALLWSSLEINGLQLSVVVLLCGVKEFLQSQRKSSKLKMTSGGVERVMGVHPKSHREEVTGGVSVKAVG